MKNIFFLVLIFFLFGCDKNNKRSSFSLSGEGWSIWLDTAAAWQNDSLYLPGEFDIPTLPVNTPTIGWEKMESGLGKECSLPASVEEIFGTSNEWTYHGVSWFWREIDIPAAWSNKKIFLKVEQYRHRIEVFINHQLAGYDMISLTPYEVDLSGLVKTGKNTISFRITNPGGIRGWEDFHLINWGNYKIPATHDFGGIGGDVSLIAVDQIYIKDVFVKNLLPALEKNIEVNFDVKNESPQTDINYTVSIRQKENNKELFSQTYTSPVMKGENHFSHAVQIPEATLWSLDNPKLYVCNITLHSADIKDTYDQTFGFRVFETKSKNGNKNYYFNNKRVRIRSAIDWGIYALTGLYPTTDMAENSVKSAKAIDHNCISFHRRIGEPAIMNVADEMGLFIYEEPGGLHTNRSWDDANMEASPFAMKWMEEKIRRMIIRDRNHPSVIMYSLANEDNFWNPFRMNLVKMINAMDDSRIVLNASSHGGSIDSINPIYHIKAYHHSIDSDYYDWHTVNAGVGFDERDFASHVPKPDSIFTFWGEVRCYTGPPAVYQIKNQCSKKSGYDMNLYEPLSNKIEDFFNDCNLANCGSGAIKTPADITLQTARGLMYVDGRLDQIILSHNATDGFAINGWSDGPQTMDPWSSAITDAARNLKGPAEDYKFWNKPLQIAIFRNNGKYFKVGDTAKFNISLINEGLLNAGDYQLIFKLKDGIGNYSSFSKQIPVHVLGGDMYAQSIFNAMPVIFDESLHGGYVTLEALLMNNNKVVATGVEQVLLSNRKSFGKNITQTINVQNWSSASAALKDAGINEMPIQNADVILAGGFENDQLLKKMLEKSFNGSIVIIKFDSLWAAKLFEMKILSSPVTVWGGKQTPFWNGNGWGYIDHFIGNQALPSRTIISTRGWEVTGDPLGFWPFKSDYKKEAYGAYIARKQTMGYVWDKPEVHKEYEKIFPAERQLLVTYGAILYGKGKIILAPSYPVDDKNPFNDLVFFNLISKK